MYAQKKKRLILLSIITIIGFLLIFIIVNEFNKNVVFFYSPSDLDFNNNKIVRLGGLVKQHSVITHTHGNYEFIIADTKQDIKVIYQGILPDLFRENQGVVVTGKVVDSHFIATEVLAKHDENYMPKEVYETMRKNISKD
ncbi:MAG: cytochrome c maturation protein CcmE [Alphaproteobacteria bacterium]|nr:cytochrome c maturation protein CcmE [Alphaproteobacteria bacterium]OJV17258.1 MAG: cytochrome c biogenesis protein CcmE [Alphaproteobacteria bacterium 33-17]